MLKRLLYRVNLQARDLATDFLLHCNIGEDICVCADDPLHIEVEHSNPLWDVGRSGIQNEKRPRSKGVRGRILDAVGHFRIANYHCLV